MKIELTFKNPDVVDDAIQFHEEHQGKIPAKDMKVFKAMVAKFIEYDEYARIVFDTETRQVTVEPI
jgi:hypothetical protein